MACTVRAIEACVQTLRVQASARKVSADLATVRSKLQELELEEQEEARAVELAIERSGGSATRGRYRAALVPGQESQAELTRCEERGTQRDVWVCEVYRWRFACRARSPRFWMSRPPCLTTKKVGLAACYVTLCRCWACCLVCA